MPRDYKNRQAAQAPGRSPCWLWGLAGLAVGLFAAFLVYLSEQPTGAAAPVAQAPPAPAPEPAAASEPPAPEPEERPKPRFEFYSRLPEMEVPVEEPALPARDEPAPPAPDGDGDGDAGAGEPEPPRERAESGTAYLLQVGSFRSHQEADRLKASLSLLGLEPRIQTVRVDGEATWHRVRVGPYPTLGAAYRTRDRLREEQVEAIVLKAAGQ